MILKCICYYFSESMSCFMDPQGDVLNLHQDFKPCCQHEVPHSLFQFSRNFLIEGEIISHLQEGHVKKWISPHQSRLALVHRSNDVRYKEPLSTKLYQ